MSARFDFDAWLAAYGRVHPRRPVAVKPTDSVPCDGPCGDLTTDPTFCHGWVMCPRCLDGWTCPDCKSEARDGE